MRKFLYFILAIILAFTVITGGLIWKSEIQFSEINQNTIYDIWLPIISIEDNIQKQEEKSIETKITIKQPEENLNYNERIKKGDYYFERGFLTFAANEYVKAANLNPNNIDPYLKLLKTNYELGDYKKAQKNAETILQINPGYTDSKFTLALIYIRQSNFESAVSILDSLTSARTTDPRVTYYKGILKIAFGKHDEGKVLLKQAKVENQDPKLDKKIDLFLDAYREYEFAKGSEELYLSELLARSCNKAEEYEIAIYKLKNILKTRNDLRDAWILFGFAYLNLEKYYFAKTAFEKAYELDPEWPSTQYFLGITNAELNNLAEAIKYLNYALANRFKPVIVIYQKLGDLYLETQNYEKSVEFYEKVLEINNTDINSFVRPVWLYLDFLKQPGKALDIAKSAVTVFPESAMSYNLIGWSEINSENFIEAEKNLKKAIEMDKNLPAAYYNIGNLYRLQNKKNQAMENYKKAYELDLNGSIGSLSAKAYNELMSD